MLTPGELSDRMQPVKIADLVSKPNAKVKIRVPSELRATLGEKARGIVRKVTPKGSVTWVQVKVGARLYDFRPQDLSPA